MFAKPFTGRAPSASPRLLTFLLAATGLACGDSSGDGPAGVTPRFSIALTNEQSDVSYVFVTEARTGFVALRGPDGPIVYVMQEGGRVVRFAERDDLDAATLQVGDLAITRADVDADGEREYVVETPAGIATYEPADMQQGGVGRQAQALSLDDLDQAIDALIEDLATMRGDPRVAWVLDLIRQGEDVADQAVMAYDDALAKLDETLSQWSNSDPLASPADEDRQLVSQDVIEVPEARQEQVATEVFDEAHDRLTGVTPRTDHFGDAVSEQVSRTETEPVAWSPSGAVEVPDGGASDASRGTVKCVVSRRGDNDILALVEQACVDSAEVCTEMGGESFGSDSASGCAQWCERGTGIELASSELDGQNLLCYETKCVAQPGLVSNPQPLSGDDACAAGCAAEYCEQDSTPPADDAWYEAELDGTPLPVEEGWYPGALYHPYPEPGYVGYLEIELDPWFDAGNNGYLIRLKLDIPSTDFVGECQSSENSLCDIWYTEYENYEYTLQWQSFGRPGANATITITRNDGGWLEGTFEGNMRGDSYTQPGELSTAVEDPETHLLKGSFRAERPPNL